MNKKPITAHFNQYLGQESDNSGGTNLVSGQSPDVRIYRYDNKPVDHAFSLASVGLHKTIFHQPDGQPVRHEILFCAWQQFLSDKIYACLFEYIAYQQSQPGSITIGELFNFEAPVCDNSKMEAFVFYEPGYFDEGLAVFDGVTPQVVMAWAIPIHRKELAFIEQNGASAFDELLAEHDPDLLDLARKPIVE